MVQKFCPECKDWIPVACKTCPCGHKFAKTVAESAKTAPDETENDSQLGRQENGRPRRRSAMNSLYYHSSLQLSSYKLAKHAATVSARRKSSADNNSIATSPDAVNGDSEPTTNGHLPRKRRRGRPRLRPRPYSSTEEIEDSKPDSEPIEEETMPLLRRRRPGLISTNLGRANDMYSHSNNFHDTESKSSKNNRAINESESYSKLYQTLNDAKKKHFSYILDDINFKFKRNSNFPL